MRTTIDKSVDKILTVQPLFSLFSPSPPVRKGATKFEKGSNDRRRVVLEFPGRFPPWMETDPTRDELIIPRLGASTVQTPLIKAGGPSASFS